MKTDAADPTLSTTPGEWPNESGYSKWGLDAGDIDLIRWMMDKTPAERLRFAEGFATSVKILKNGRRV